MISTNMLNAYPGPIALRGGGGNLKPIPKYDTFSLNQNISFTGRINDRQFALANCQTLPCPCCGVIMSKDISREKLIDEIANSKGIKLSENIKKCADKIRDGRQLVAKELEELAIKQPEESLHGLLNISYNRHLKALSGYQISVIDSFFDKFPEAASNEKVKEMFGAFFEYQKALIKYSTNEGQFRNKKFKDCLIHMCDSYNLNVNRDKILNYFEKLPKSTNNKDAFFVKYARRGDYEIAGALLKDNSPTIEHIEPYSEHKNNSFSNLLVMCADCNNERGNMPYKLFVKKHPNMSRNFEIYTNAATKELQKAKYGEKYDNYIKDVRETFTTQVYGNTPSGI